MSQPEKKPTEPANVTDPNVPFVVVGGKKWPVPPLAPRQNRIIIPLAMKNSSINPADVSPEQLDTIYEIVFQGLTRAHPTLTRDEFMDMATDLEDMMNGFNVVLQQTRMMRKVEEAPPALGEDGARQNLPTGTDTLLTS